MKNDVEYWREREKYWTTKAMSTNNTSDREYFFSKAYECTSKMLKVMHSDKQDIRGKVKI